MTRTPTSTKVCGNNQQNMLNIRKCEHPSFRETIALDRGPLKQRRKVIDSLLRCVVDRKVFVSHNHFRQPISMSTERSRTSCKELIQHVSDHWSPNSRNLASEVNELLDCPLPPEVLWMNEWNLLRSCIERFDKASRRHWKNSSHAWNNWFPRKFLLDNVSWQSMIWTIDVEESAGSCGKYTSLRNFKVFVPMGWIRRDTIFDPVLRVKVTTVSIWRKSSIVTLEKHRSLSRGWSFPEE